MAVDLLRVATDYAGRLHRRGDLAYGVWGAYLIDLVLGGVAEVDGGVMVARGGDPGTLSPLVVRGCWDRLERALPRAVGECFYKDVAPLNKVVRQLEHWAWNEISPIREGVGDEERAAVLQSTPERALRSSALKALAASTTITVGPHVSPAHGGIDDDPADVEQVNAILASTRRMLALSYRNSVPFTAGNWMGP
jgi:hypothetical protein